MGEELGNYVHKNRPGRVLGHTQTDRQYHYMGEELGNYVHQNKLEEFKRLGYPIPMLKQMCNYIATTTGNGTWINIRNNIT